MKTINELVAEAHAYSISNGFWKANSDIGNKLMLIVTELGEFFEKYRKDDFSPDEHCPEFTNQTIEIADAMIRIFDLAGRLGIGNHLQEAIEAKMAYNNTRPYLHGKKF